MQFQPLLTIFSTLGGAVVTGVVMLYANRQTRKQSEIASLLDALQADNHDLREENQRLRGEIESLRRDRWGNRQDRQERRDNQKQ